MLLKGDHKTKFIHTTTTIIRNKNLIKKLIKDNDDPIETKARVEKCHVFLP